MQRRQLIKGIAALTVAEYLGTLHAAWAAGDKLPAPGIFRIKGEVKVNGKLARQGTPVQPGDIVTTGPQSEAIYVIGQDAYLQRDRSTVSITGDTLKSGLRVLSGKLMAVFGKGDKRIDTSTATIGIRGTGCYIEAEEKKVYFCLCYGTAEVAALNAPEKIETIVTKHHDKPVYLHADGQQMMAPAAMINHSDDELTLLESLVGRIPPFYGQPGFSYK